MTLVECVPLANYTFRTFTVMKVRLSFQFLVLRLFVFLSSISCDNFSPSFSLSSLFSFIILNVYIPFSLSYSSISLLLSLSLSSFIFIYLSPPLTLLPHSPLPPPPSLQGGTSKDLREVRQFHFTAWPDFGVPDFPTSMLSMIRCVRAHHNRLPQETGPMIVHCSAGVGRTGTFIVIDSMLQRILHGEESVDIYAHVTLLRNQRSFMVQTEVRGLP